MRCPIKREERATVYWQAKGNTEVVSTKNSDKKYVYDRVFNPDEDNQVVFNDIGREIIDCAMKGFNSTIFAYGQTSSGKTHTMMGPDSLDSDDRGLIPQGIEKIFDHIERSKEKTFLLRVSYMEIYNECVYDLLAQGNSAMKQDLKVQENAEGTIEIVDLNEVPVNSVVDMLNLMDYGQGKRNVAATGMNERSSRSHTIFKIIIESIDGNEADMETDGKAVKVSHLNLVDLAGSERAKQTGPPAKR